MTLSQISIDRTFEGAMPDRGWPVQSRLRHHLEAVVARSGGLPVDVGAILDELVRLSDIAPPPDWVAHTAPWKELLGNLAETAVAAGELRAADLEMTVETLRAMITGLVLLGSLMPSAQAGAAEGLKRLLRGMLLETPAADFPDPFSTAGY